LPNPGKSAEVKKRIGAKSADVGLSLSLSSLNQMPEPRRRLEQSGLALWKETFATGQTWLKETDLELLQIACEQVDEREQLRAYVLENMEAWHERAALRVLERDVQSNFTQLGLTPISRQKLGIQEVKAYSKLQELMDRNEEA
jgi:phage terminase small subunit